MTGRIIALDVGDRTVGVAMTDELQITAQPVTTISYAGKHELKKAFQSLFEILEGNSVSHIVSGLPLNMNGTEGPQAEKTRDFIHGFQNFLKKQKQNPEDYEWIFWDERLSTTGAERSLLSADLSRAKRKKVIDKMAAVFILQGFLESELNR